MRTLSTTRADNGALTTRTPGRPGGGGLDPLLAAVLQRRMAATPRPGSGLVGGRAPEIPSAPAPAYRPSLGSSAGASQGSAQPQTEGRWVPDPFASPYYKMEHGAGSEPPARFERLINGKWEFSDLRPQGSGGRPDLESKPSGGYASAPRSDDRMAQLNADQDEASYGDQRRQAATMRAPRTKPDQGAQPGARLLSIPRV